MGKVLVSDENGNAKWESIQKAMELGSTGAISRAGSGVGSWCPLGSTCGVTGYQDFVNEVPEGYEFGNYSSMDGDYAMVSSRDENVGSIIACGVVYVYKFSGVEWEPVQKIIPSEKIAFQYFRVLGISGKWAVLGSRVGGAFGFGRLDIYELKDDGLWYPFQTIDNTTNEDFSIDFNGDFIVRGYPFVTGISSSLYGRVEIIQYKGGTWSFSQSLVDVGGTINSFGSMISIQGRQMAIAGIRALPGDIAIYNFDGAAWNRTSIIHYGSGLNENIKLFGNLLLVGRPSDNLVCGSVALFYKDPVGGWMFRSLIENADRRPNDAFGLNIALNDNYAMISCHNHDTSPLYDNGSILLYKVDPAGGLVYNQTMILPDRQSGDGLGTRSLCINKDNRFMTRISRRGPSIPQSRIMFGRLEF